MTDREKLIELLEDFFESTFQPFIINSIADFLIANGVTIQEKGEWEAIGRDRGYVCSNCGSRCLLNYESDWHESKFCPHCGADMRKSDNYE